MYTVSFIYRPGSSDDEFHRLNDEIRAVAAATEGFLGTESWVSPDGPMGNVVYYWEHLDHLEEFSNTAGHLQAKREYRRWS